MTGKEGEIKLKMSGGEEGDDKEREIEDERRGRRSY